MMRIISGMRRGKKLESLPGSNTRPTLERVKQAVFNAIQFEIADKTVLDLFAGSGQLGLEALSRGAKFCYFNDMSQDACRVISNNINACGFDKLCKLTCKTYTDCAKMIKSSFSKVSLVFLDPPYGNGLVNDALKTLITEKLLDDGAIVVCESSAEDEIDTFGLKLRKEYNYSGIKITMLEKDG